MRKPTFFKPTFVVLFFLLNVVLYSQNRKAFTPRFDKDLKGDMLLIGNNILSENNNPYNNNAQYNSNISMQYIDIDGDGSTFSSSSANLTIPNSGCFKIAYAGLYWGAILQSGNRSTINTVKLKLPTGGYNNISGQVIYDAINGPISGNTPYACYADVTTLLQAQASAQGTYTVANVVSSTGLNGGTGLSAGWSLFVVYEDPTLTGKSIVSYDGFSGIGGPTVLDIPVTGFRTIPVGPVRAKFAFSCLEGDKPIAGDYLQINGSTVGTAQRPTNNFFNSSITDVSGSFTNRVPNGSNTLGFDAGI
jgi:hypothetical protein